MSKQMNETPVYSRNIGWDMKISYNSDNLTEYVGMAFAGAATSAAAWQIYKLAYNANNQVTSRRYASATDDFTEVWDDRVALEYVDI